MKQYFVKATASWKDSSRRSGGYFTYSDVVKENALIVIEGNTAIIYSTPIAAGYVVSDVKKLTGKYFSFSGKEVKEATFNKHFKARQEQAMRLKVECEAKQKQAAQEQKAAIDKKYAAIKAVADSIVIDEQWLKEKADAMTLRSAEKSRAFTAAFKGLLARNGKEQRIDYFFEVMRIL